MKTYGRGGRWKGGKLGRTQFPTCSSALKFKGKSSVEVYASEILTISKGDEREKGVFAP